ncbi:MAG: hypothetical protein JWN44_247 [Myxococcales bacterium]|nr:hypothetical protein [Myxococcales bacterium]
MLTLIPALALGAMATGCDDDTSVPADMTMKAPDLAKIPDMAHSDG